MGALTSSRSILAAAQALDPAEAGGKAAALARLAADFPIPGFFVIRAGAFTGTGLSETAEGELDAALQDLGDGPFAVRSSGREEDGASAAHAGQFVSELNVPRDQVRAAALRVWRSGFSPELAAYRRAHGLSDAPHPPAVIVQRMVTARAAGVAFSADPVSGVRSEAVVSAVAGLADRLAAGEVDGDVYRIDAEGRTLSEQIEGDVPVLDASERAEVAALARACEVRSGGVPQDVEWAFEGTSLILLQSRPITTLARGSPSGDATEALIWDNSNIVESYPGVVSPLTFSFARYVYAHVYQAFARLAGVPRMKVEANRQVFEALLGRIDGRVYYNLLNWYRALALFPGFKANRAFMETMMGVSEALPEATARRIAPPADSAWEKVWDQVRLARVGLGLIVEEIRIRPTIEAFHARLKRALATPDETIDSLDLGGLALHYRGLEADLLTRWDAPLINDFLCMIAFGASRRALERWAGAEGLVWHSEQLIGQGDIISAEPARRIRDMGAMIAGRAELIARLGRGDREATADHPALAAELADYIRVFGDRCTEELKLESATLHEDPTSLLKAVAAAAIRPAEAAGAHPPARPLRDVLPNQRLKRTLAAWLTAWSKARVRDRENLRFERTRLFGRVRRVFRAMGMRLVEQGHLGEADDVFLLTVEEVLGAIEGTGVADDLSALVALRRREDEAARARPDPPERLSLRPGERRPVAAASGPDPARIPAEETGDAVRKGIACCRGIVEGRVRVVSDPRVEALAPGEILVARHTDPGWIAVFANAAGVIAERGSLLSHSAIVAREMGVPCVVALKGATTWLKTGDLVRLDGGAGRVERLGRNGE